MPNWTANHLLIVANNDEQQEYLNELKESITKHKEFFRFVKPIPFELSETYAGYSGDPKEQASNEAKEKVNIEKYGYSNWYDYCINQWGTKWEAKEIDVQEESNNSLQITFDTAWSPPLPIYDILVDKGFEIKATYAEQGCAFMGYYENNSTYSTDLVQEFDDEDDFVSSNFEEFFISNGFEDLMPAHYGG
jgi:HSP90 family molecular chaperone